MRARLPSLAFVLLAIPLAAAATISACGGTDTDNNDGGPDATADVDKKDVAQLDSAPIIDAGCQNDVDLTAYLPSADASIDVDAGGFDIAECTGCLKDTCGNQINACNSDCDCRQGVVDAVTCLANGGTVSTCFTNALSSGNVPLQSLIGCAANGCVAACIPSDAGVDAGSADASGD